jgi:hypothetical protein
MRVFATAMVFRVTNSQSKKQNVEGRSLDAAQGAVVRSNLYAVTTKQHTIDFCKLVPNLLT